MQLPELEVQCDMMEGWTDVKVEIVIKINTHQYETLQRNLQSFVRRFEIEFSKFGYIFLQNEILV